MPFSALLQVILMHPFRYHHQLQAIIVYNITMMSRIASEDTGSIWTSYHVKKQGADKADCLVSKQITSKEQVSYVTYIHNKQRSDGGRGEPAHYY